jgi:hypothetical protein
MGMLKKGSRLIIVDEVQYRWRVRQRRPYYRADVYYVPMLLVVETADNPRAKLVVELLQEHPADWMLRPVNAVLPSQAADYLRAGIAAGWDADIRGKPFVVRK